MAGLTSPSSRSSTFSSASCAKSSPWRPAANTTSRPCGAVAMCCVTRWRCRPRRKVILVRDVRKLEQGLMVTMRSSLFQSRPPGAERDAAAKHQQCDRGSAGHSGMPDNEYADGMVEHNGDVGKLLKTLEDLGVGKDTIVVYTTDNGPHMNSWPDAVMTPFRSEKDTNWEGAFRVPAMVRWR